MNEIVDQLLTQLEELSARAVDFAGEGNTVAAADVIAERGTAIERLKLAIASSEPLSYTDWNRLVVIHCQGNRIHANLQTAREQIASEVVECARENAFLECVGGVVEQTGSSQLNESA
jgi:hypothetical protein